MQKLKKAVTTLKNVISDIKAEVVITDLLEQGIDNSEIIVLLNGAFDRNYKKDITDYKLNTLNKSVVLNLSRNSLYDVLPEGLFHPVTRYGSLDAKDRKKEFEVQLKEEANARKFFQPVDNELLWHKVKLETEARKLIHDPWDSLDKLFVFDKVIPAVYQSRFKRYLPFTNEIKGNSELTAFVLADILQDKVIITTGYEQELHSNDSFQICKLGDYQPAENFICGLGFYDEINVWEFTIELTDDYGIEKYVDPDLGYMNALITKFCDYFVPVELDTRIRIVCSTARAFCLDDSTGKNKMSQSTPGVYLGFNAMI